MYDALPQGTQLDHDKYQIENVLGRGGFGITYKATHKRLSSVAIKEFYPQEHAARLHTTGQIFPRTSPEAYERGLKKFIQEGLILERVNHPNVVRVRDLFEERGTAYLVMELIEGRTLRDELNAKPQHRLRSSQVGVIIESIVEALVAVHKKGIYHLDIKPENILLTEDGQVKLVDFGAARQGLSSKTTQAYSPAYAAPEVIAGIDVGPASDLFELGMMLQEMLIGEPPPSATARLMSFAVHNKDCWNPSGHTSPWKELLIDALQLKIEKRSQNVGEWWNQAKEYWKKPQPEEIKKPQEPIKQPQEPIKQPQTNEKSTKSGLTTILTLFLVVSGAWGLKTWVDNNGHYQAALSHIEAERWDEATRELESALRDNPSSTAARNTLNCINISSSQELEQAISTTSNCQVIRVLDGVYYLYSKQVIARSLKVVGSSKDKTRIISNADGAVLEFNGYNNPQLTLQKIRFEYQGSRPANILSVFRGSVDIEDCVFTGAKWDEKTKNAGRGIIFFDGKGSVKSNTFLSNDTHGIEIQGEAQPTLEGNTLRNNKVSGIAYFKNAGGVARYNVAENNSFGILVGDRAQPNLEGNTLRGNQVGIGYFQTSGGNARYNVAEKNSIHGTQVANQAQPNLEGNSLRGNQGNGIAYFQNSGGKAINNKVINNAGYGVYTKFPSTPVIQGNQGSGNKKGNGF